MAKLKFICYLRFQPEVEVSGTSPRQVGPASDFCICFKLTLFGKVFVFSYPLGGYIFVKVIVFFFICCKTNLELLYCRFIIIIIIYCNWVVTR